MASRAHHRSTGGEDTPESRISQGAAAAPSSAGPLLDLTPLEEGLRRNPYGTVAAAFGIGFVLGGGLFTRMTGRIVGAAVRVGLTAALPFLQEELLSGALRSASTETDRPPATAERSKRAP